MTYGKKRQREVLLLPAFLYRAKTGTDMIFTQLLFLYSSFSGHAVNREPENRRHR